MTANLSALQMFELHRERLRAFLASEGLSAQDIDDVLQEVFLRFVRSVERRLVIGDPLAYLFGITRHVLAEGYRRRPPDAVDIEDVQVEDDHQRSSVPERAVETSQLQQAIDALGPVDKALIILRHRVGLRHKEIGRELNLSPHTVRKYLKRAEAHLRQLMIERGNRRIDGR